MSNHFSALKRAFILLCSGHTIKKEKGRKSEMELKKVGECLQEKFGNVADAVTGKAARKKKMNCVKRDLCLACYGGAMFCLGCWAGIHRNVIKALVLREKMPKAPHWHVWCH